MDQKDIQRALDEFQNDPREALARIPEKKGKRGSVLARPPTAFSREDIQSRDFISYKDEIRKRLYTISRGVMLALHEVRPGRILMEASDIPGNLVDSLRYDKPAEIDAAGLASAELAEKPWSSDYWPTYLGILGRRYHDPAFPASTSWKKNFDYIEAHPAAEIVKSRDAGAIDDLSPSEKYDLLVGDTRGALTAAMWAEGEAYYNDKSKVETWMGICDGWAAASYMLRRPRERVTVLAADGVTSLHFYPDDIKALAALLWAKARTAVRFIGSRSNEKKPKTDDVGRLISLEAFDVNPGTFHLACVNQIGVSQRSFIIDATYDYEVWNQPILGYEYKYFNPEQMQAVPDLKSAIVQRDAFTSDRFRKYRGAGAVAFAGVYMRVRYISETKPSHELSDSPARDLVVSVDYTYDLELDKDGRITGGEWYKNVHPDFLWTPPPGARALSSADILARGPWDPAAPLPVSWQVAAQRASTMTLPLAKIVERLIELANP